MVAITTWMRGLSVAAFTSVVGMWMLFQRSETKLASSSEDAGRLFTCPMLPAPPLPGVRAVKVVTGARLADGPRRRRKRNAVSGECIPTRWRGPTWTMCIHPEGDLVSDVFRSRGMWEKSALARFAADVARLGPDGLVLDIGANLGEYGLLAAQMGRHAILVEPVHSNVEKIEETVVANGWDKDGGGGDPAGNGKEDGRGGAAAAPAIARRIHIVQAAMSCHSVLGVFGNERNRGGSRAVEVSATERKHLAAWSSKRSSSTGSSTGTSAGAVLGLSPDTDHRYVPGVTLDSLAALPLDLIPASAARDGIVIKLDAEGAECDAVMSGAHWLRRHAESVRALYIEWGNYGRGRLPDPADCDVAAMVDFLYELGLRPFHDVTTAADGPLLGGTHGLARALPFELPEALLDRPLFWRRLYRSQWRTWPWDIVFYPEYGK